MGINNPLFSSIHYLHLKTRACPVVKKLVKDD
jgi:hypothetical protein